MTTRDLPEAFLALAAQLGEFRGVHGRFPVQCDAADPHERRLGDFLRVNRRALALYRRGERQEGTVMERVSHLDYVAPGWRTEKVKPHSPRVPNVAFPTRVQAVKRFINTHERFPSTEAASAEERSLGRFLDNMKQAKKGRGTIAWNRRREAMLGREVPGWDTDNRGRFAGRVEELRAFVTANGRPPRRQPGRMDAMNSAERHESSLANLVANTRATGSAERLRVLDETLALAA